MSADEGNYQFNEEQLSFVKIAVKGLKNNLVHKQGLGRETLTHRILCLTEVIGFFH